MITKEESISRLQRRLDDETEEVWTREQLGSFLQDGYDKLCRSAECIYDQIMYDTQPRTGNYTREFELEFMDTPILARFTVTRPSDAEYTDGNALVSNHTNPDNANFMTEDGHTPTTRTTVRLPPGVVSVDRVTHDWLRLDPEHDRYHRKTRSEYQTLEGGVFSYQMDQDGWQTLRLVNVPVRVIPPDEISGVYGGIRRVTSYGMDEEPLIGSYGGLRSVPRHFNSGQYGGIRRIVPDDNATRVEVFRLGDDLDETPYEVPDRAVKYIEWWAMYRAYGMPGEGENKKLADHFKQRFEQGVETIKSRVQSTMRERTIAMGAKRETSRDAYLEHFPADFGYSRPFNRG